MEFLIPSPETVQRVASFLDDGNIAALPTETVYGLGADATNRDAVEKIFKAKGRPDFNPLIVHVSSIDMARKISEFNSTADLLAQTYWPGPLTFILPLRESAGIAGNVTAGLKTIGVRMPASDVTRAIIDRLGKPVAAPSANASGSLSPTKPEHVARSLAGRVDMIVTGGKADIGLESTIIDLTSEQPVLLRAGFVTRDAIEQLIGCAVIDNTKQTENTAPTAPGQMLKHYAPKTPLRLNAVDVQNGEALLAFGSVKFMGLKSGGHVRDLPLSHYMNLSETGDLGEAASNLFSMLHALDLSGAERIAVMNVPDQGIGRAINDRLTRAAESA